MVFKIINYKNMICIQKMIFIAWIKLIKMKIIQIVKPLIYTIQKMNLKNKIKIISYSKKRNNNGFIRIFYYYYSHFK